MIAVLLELRELLGSQAQKGFLVRLDRQDQLATEDSQVLLVQLGHLDLMGSLANRGLRVLLDLKDPLGHWGNLARMVLLAQSVNQDPVVVLVHLVHQASLDHKEQLETEV